MNGARHPEQPLIVALDERANGVLTTLPRKRDKLFVALSAKLGLLSKDCHLHVDVSFCQRGNPKIHHFGRQLRRTTLFAMISSTDGNPLSATSGSGVSPASDVPATDPTGADVPTSMRPTMPACSCGTQ